jgi:hypothetical protein
MLGRGKTSASKIVHFFTLFSTVLSGFALSKVPGMQWTFVPALPIMKKINHLGVNNLVPRRLESTSNLPRTGLAREATSPGSQRYLNDHRGFEGGQTL